MAADVGAVVECRPVGATWFIDEGQAEWKILVVSTDPNEVLTSATQSSMFSTLRLAKYKRA